MLKTLRMHTIAAELLWYCIGVRGLNFQLYYTSCYVLSLEYFDDSAAHNRFRPLYSGLCSTAAAERKSVVSHGLGAVFLPASSLFFGKALYLPAAPYLFINRLQILTLPRARHNFITSSDATATSCTDWRKFFSARFRVRVIHRFAHIRTTLCPSAFGILVQ